MIESILLPYEEKVRFQANATNSMIDADPFHLRCLISNLVDNALKYSDDVPDVVVETYNKGNNLVIAVRDQGIGIAPEYQKKVFNQFFRIPYGDVHNVKGFGIGLSYVKQIVRAHHWHLGLESALGKGSTFKITIPQKHA